MDFPFPTMMSKNLYFRPFQTTDVQDVLKLFSDQETMMFDGGETLHHVTQAHEFINVYSKFYPGNSTAVRWAVISRKNNQFVGSCGFHKIDYHHKRAEIGGELLKPYRSTGLAAEGMLQLIQFGFFSLGLNRLTAMISPKNKSAIALIEKSPFKKEGCLKEWEQWNGQWEDLNVYGLLKREWIERKAAKK